MTARNVGSVAAARRDDVIPARSNVKVTGPIATQAEQSEGCACFCGWSLHDPASSQAVSWSA
ncbi:hypothetical protein [Ensifer sp. M14]|uniref:hypothetical protein n=1 Tax=Ensifer sp. M14 TaxID=2203782 RepID=UPI0011C04CC7|nr:hypothetical protein [Ensifer sp. M14]